MDDHERGILTQISLGCVEWKVDTLGSLKVHEWCCSPEFSFSGTDWQLFILREYIEIVDGGHFFLWLSRGESNPDSTMDVEYTLSIKGHDGDMGKKPRNRKKFEESENSPWIPISWLYDEELSELLEDTITVECHLKCFNSTQAAAEKMSHDFKELMQSADYSDVIIKVKEKEFQLHRAILSARSPYFHSMFSCDMKEKSTGVVEINDCEPDIFHCFIHFLYTGQVEELSPKNVCKLYEVADKYQENQLKSQCLDFMVNAISVVNFCNFTALALRYEEKELLQAAVRLFNSKESKITRSVKWQNFVGEYPTEANELLIGTFLEIHFPDDFNEWDD